MSNMMDYLAWRGDVSMAYSPFNDLDSLILATLCYLGFPEEPTEIGSVPIICPPPSSESLTFFQEIRTLMCAAAMTERFAGVVMHHPVDVIDQEQDMQFAAVTAALPDGTHVVCFRGTDDSIVGWREDFNMAFESPVPAQRAAVDYLREIAGSTEGPLILCGHSKGGNLSVYAAAHAEETTQERIRAVYSFDGPGLDDATMVSDGYGRIARKIRSFVPNRSVVGLLMTYHPEYTVVKSDGIGLSQHDPFTWHALGTHLTATAELDVSSQLVDQTVHAWLSQVSPEERRQFVTTLFDLLEATGATTVKQLLTDVPGRATALLKALQKVDRHTARMMISLMGQFVSIGAQNIVELIRSRIEATDTPQQGDT